MIKNNRKKSSDKFWQFKNNAYLCIAIAKKQVAQRENSSVGRAQPCQGWGRGFESRFSLKENIHIRSRRILSRLTIAKIAQLVEHNLAKVGVAGSSPVFRSNSRRLDQMSGWWNW